MSPELQDLVGATKLVSVAPTLVQYVKGELDSPRSDGYWQNFHCHTYEADGGFRVVLHLVAGSPKSSQGSAATDLAEFDHHAHIHIEALYTVSDDVELDMGEATLYGRTSGILHTYPFAREAISSLSGRSGEPLLIDPSPMQP